MKMHYVSMQDTFPGSSHLRALYHPFYPYQISRGTRAQFVRYINTFLNYYSYSKRENTSYAAIDSDAQIPLYFPGYCRWYRTSDTTRFPYACERGVSTCGGGDGERLDNVC